MDDETDGLRVWIIEDDPDYRDGIAALLVETPGLRCTGAWGTFEEAWARLEEENDEAPPHVILMDIGLPGESGIGGARRIKRRHPEAAIVMLTLHDTARYVFRALEAGASGYVVKDEPVDDIVAAVRAAHQGGMPVSPAVAAHIRSFFAAAPAAPDYGLTEREEEVLALMVEGRSHKQIAGALGISPNTVANHLRRIYRKLHVQSGIEAVAKVHRDGRR